jgi:hypothetical protein
LIFEDGEDEGIAYLGRIGWALRGGQAQRDVVDAAEAGLIDELLVLEGVRDECQELVDGGPEN